MLEFLITGGIGTVLIVLCCLNLYETMRYVWKLLPTFKQPPRLSALWVIGAVFFSHILNIWLFGFVYYALLHYWDLGTFTGSSITQKDYVLGFFDCLYFSATTYSTAAFGDITPRGGLRMIAGVESLTGFLMVGWTVSFTYLAMQKFWAKHK